MQFKHLLLKFYNDMSLFRKFLFTEINGALAENISYFIHTLQFE